MGDRKGDAVTIFRTYLQLGCVGQELRTLSGHSGKVNSVAFSADGKTLASGSDDDASKLFKGEPLRDVTAFRDVRLTPDVEEVASSGQNAANTKRTIKLTNRGGGLGRVQVFVNDREFIEDVRDRKLKQNPESTIR